MTSIEKLLFIRFGIMQNFIQIQSILPTYRSEKRCSSGPRLQNHIYTATMRNCANSDTIHEKNTLRTLYVLLSDRLPPLEGYRRPESRNNDHLSYKNTEAALTIKCMSFEIDVHCICALNCLSKFLTAL